MASEQTQAPAPVEEVREPSHRERLIDAMAASIDAKGYRETTVADVVRIAHTSRRTFYEHFEDREACFLALFDATNDATMEQIATAVRPDSPLGEQVDHALDAYFDSITTHPSLYRSFVRELPGLGQAGADRQTAVIERFAQLADRPRRLRPARAARHGPAAADDGHRDHDRRRSARARRDLAPTGP